MSNISRALLGIASVAFWPVFLVWILLELYYHSIDSDKKMFKATDRLKKAIAEATALGFYMEDLGNGHLEADLVFEVDDVEIMTLAIKDYDYEDDTEVGWFHYSYREPGESHFKHVRKIARLNVFADTVREIQEEIKIQEQIWNDAR